MILAPASSLVLKIATAAPRTSPWFDALSELASDWSRITNGEVSVKIYPDGIVGDEPDIVRKMRIRRLDGAALTQLALGIVVPDILALSSPFIVQSSEEFEFLIERLSEPLGEAFRSEGFVVLSWADAGWVHFFAEDTLRTPNDLKRTKLAVNATDDEMLQIWRELGYSAFPLGMIEYAMGLQTGMVNSFYATPALVAAYGWFGRIKYMNPVALAPILAAIVLSESAWRSVPEQYREEMARVAVEIGRKITTASRDLDRIATEALASQGVIIEKLSPEDERKWTEFGKIGGEMAAGRMFSREALETVEALLAEYRANHTE